MNHPSGLALRADQVQVQHGGRRAIDSVSLVVAPGEHLALIGPSGAGKTTLLSVLGAALCPTQGQVSIDERNPWALGPSALRRLRASLFIAPQTPPLPPRQRVVTAVLAGRLAHWSNLRAMLSLWRPVESQRAHDALAQFALQERLWSRVDQLSGGERQRVSLARMMVSDARLLLVDEPLSALDPALADRTMAALVARAHASQATLVCSLHQVDLARKWFPRLVGLREGRCVFDRDRSSLTAAMIEQLYEGDAATRVGRDAAGTAIDAPDSTPAFATRAGLCR